MFSYSSRRDAREHVRWQFRTQLLGRRGFPAEAPAQEEAPEEQDLLHQRADR